MSYLQLTRGQEPEHAEIRIYTSLKRKKKGVHIEGAAGRRDMKFTRRDSMDNEDRDEDEI